MTTPRQRSATGALLLAALATAQLLVGLDYNIVFVALPEIASLGFSPETLQWVVSAYAIAFGGFLLLCGRLTDAVGRWSMIDIFVIIILMSAFHTPLARVTPGAASLYFCLVVILTMLSAYFFDPRLIWDKAREHTKNMPSENLTTLPARYDR